MVNFKGTSRRGHRASSQCCALVDCAIQ
jgi:hypothetical protein